MRGSDFEYAPLFFAYLIIFREKVDKANQPILSRLHLLGDKRFNNKIDNHFLQESFDVTVRNYTDILADLSTIVSSINSILNAKL